MAKISKEAKIQGGYPLWIVEVEDEDGQTYEYRARQMGPHINIESNTDGFWAGRIEIVSKLEDQEFKIYVWSGLYSSDRETMIASVCYQDAWGRSLRR